ncbi:MAG: flagellar biosynthesis protein FlgD [Novosphingobium sp.]|nr:flagellar biosynthesis protein FlgD [Novosphingobium sp.]
MMTNPIHSSLPASQPQTRPSAGRGLDSLGQGDFLRMMTAQLRQQDPFDPVDQKEMLAQMVQFSSLAGIAEINRNLKDIAARLDAISAARQLSDPTPTSTEQEF